MKIRFGLLLVLLTALFVVPLAQAQDARTPQQICDEATVTEPATREFTQAEQIVQPGVDYSAVLCTGAGAIYIDLFENLTPITVNNFVFLSEQGYYNNTTFHRVIADFMVQGGDPTGTGTGGPGYQFQDEFVGFLTFDEPGWLAMANAGPGTNGSQFFVTTVPTPHLNYAHTIFGKVIEGQENVAAIDLRDPNTATTPGESLNTVVIITDPAEVETTYVAPEPAGADAFDAALAELNAAISEPLLVDTESSGVYTTEETLQHLTNEQRDAATALFEAHGHQFRVQHRVTNSTCDMQTVPFMAIGYTLDRYASAEDAAAALADGWYETQFTDDGYTSEEAGTLPYPVLRRNRTVCEVEATEAVTFFQRGSSVAIASVIFPADHQAPAALWLTDIVANNYEALFGAELRSDMN